MLLHSCVPKSLLWMLNLLLFEGPDSAMLFKTALAVLKIKVGSQKSERVLRLELNILCCSFSGARDLGKRRRQSDLACRFHSVHGTHSRMLHAEACFSDACTHYKTSPL